MPSSNHAEQAVGIIVWTRSEEKLVVRGARTAVEAELESPNFVDLYSLAARVAQRTEKRARRGIERIDPAPGNVVADQNRVAHWTEISGSLRETPWRMKRAVRGEVCFQGSVNIKNVHETALCLVESGVGYPDLAIDVLNAVGSELFRYIGIAKRFHIK